MEGGAHLEGVEALLIEQVELLQAPAHQLHGEASGIDGGVGVQGWNDLHKHISVSDMHQHSSLSHIHQHLLLFAIQHLKLHIEGVTMCKSGSRP